MQGATQQLQGKERKTKGKTNLNFANPFVLHLLWRLIG